MIIGQPFPIGGTERIPAPFSSTFPGRTFNNSPGVKELLYLGCGRRDLPVRAATAGRLLLLGGEPFAERIVMWWNFVARTGEEIAAARDQWISGNVFGTVHGYPGDPLSAPPLPPTPLLPRGRQR